MTKEDYIAHCERAYGTSPDYPFEDLLDTAVLRHADNRKWYALLMRLSPERLSKEGKEKLTVVNLKMPSELWGSFGEADGVYPAYHMNKAHWVSVVLEEASFETVALLTEASYRATAKKKKPS